MDQSQFRPPNINESMANRSYDGRPPAAGATPQQPNIIRPAVPPPVPDSLRRGHSMPFGEQHTVEINTLPLASQTMFQSSSGRPQVPTNLTGPQLAQQPQPLAQPQVQPNQPYQQPYDFIFDPSNQPKSNSRRGPSLPGLSPRLGRIAFVIVGFLLLIIIFSVIKSSLGGSSNLPQLVAVAQDQTEILHLANETNQQSGLTASDQNLVATLNSSVTSSYGQLQAYIVANGHKVNPKEFQLKISGADDKELSSAETAGTYDQAFAQVMSGQLNVYIRDLSTAYNVTKGPKGRALLSSDYKQAQLIEKKFS
jgi:hypothetical protein